MKAIFIILSIFMSISAFAQSSGAEKCMEEAQSTLELEYCQQAEFTFAESKLREEYTLWAQLQPNEDKAYIEIMKAHRAWAVKRDATCAKEVADREGGTSQGFAKLECLAKLTQSRISAFRNRWVF